MYFRRTLFEILSRIRENLPHRLWQLEDKIVGADEVGRKKGGAARVKKLICCTRQRVGIFSESKT